MNKFKLIIIVLATLQLLSGCLQTNKKTINRQTQILGHRAYGIKGYNDTLMDNTLPAIKKAFEFSDGVELDIQMSLDGTIWVYHDPQFYNQDSVLISIPQLTDQQIKNIFTYLHPHSQINTLEEILSYMGENHINKVISLDVKIIFNPGCFSNGYATADYLRNLADQIIALKKKYNVSSTIMAETESEYLLDYLKENSEIKTFLLGFSNFERLIKKTKKKGYTGISHNFSDTLVTFSSMKYAHRKGLLIQLWTPNSKNDIDDVLKLHPDFIQTDNIKYFKDNLYE